MTLLQVFAEVIWPEELLRSTFAEMMGVREMLEELFIRQGVLEFHAAVSTYGKAW